MLAKVILHSPTEGAQGAVLNYPHRPDALAEHSGYVGVAQAVDEAHYNDLALVPSESSHPFPYLLAVHSGLT